MINKLKGYIAAAITFILVLLYMFFKGKSIGKRDQQIKQIFDNEKLKKKMDEAPSINSDAELDRVLQDGTY